jgi:hypothetical protein
MTATAEEEAAAMVAAVRDDPGERLELAARFYDRRTGRLGIRSGRRAEVAFMRWQIRRGVLAAPGADRPGSPWWRAVNASVCSVSPRHTIKKILYCADHLAENRSGGR